MKANFLKGYIAQQGTDYISVKAEIDEALAYFDNVDANKKAIARKVFTRVGQNGAKAARSSYGSVLKRRSGKLKKSIKSHYYDDRVFQWIEVFPEADSGKPTGKHSGKAGGFRYGWALGAGYTVIASKTHPSVYGHKTILRFQIDGKWISTHSIKVDAKDYVETPVLKYVKSSKCSADMDKEVGRQLDYWTGRISSGKVYKNT